MDQQTEHNNTFINWCLSILVACFTWIETSSADQLYTWIFRGLTLISLVLIIIINFPKAFYTIFPKFKKHEK